MRKGDIVVVVEEENCTDERIESKEEHKEGREESLGVG